MRRALGLLLVVLVAASAPAGRAARPQFLKVQQFSPRHGKLLVPLTARVRVRFSRGVDPASVGPDTALLRTLNGTAVAVNYAVDRGGRRLTMTPAAPLVPGTDYEVIIRPGVVSENGLTLQRERHAIFFTNPRVPPASLIRPDQFTTLGAAMSEGRAGHSATVLGDGRVLLAGGMSELSSYAAGGDVFDPGSNSFRAAGGALRDPRAFHAAVKFKEGAMLVAGTGTFGALDTTEVYFPQADQFSPGPQLREQRDFVAACELKDGRVLVVGGLSYNANGALYSSTAEIYDASIGGFRLTAGAPLRRRAGHTLTRLPDGRVLIVGGQSGSSPATAEIFDPADETFTFTVGAPAANRQLHCATLLDFAGDVLLADGGYGMLEFYEASSGTFRSAGGASVAFRSGATGSLLPNGDVLLAGGLTTVDGAQVALDTFDLYRRGLGDYGSASHVDVVFPEPRYGHTATTLDDARVLYAGGFGTADPKSIATAVVFTPDPPLAK